LKALLEGSIPTLESALRFRKLRSAALAANVTNADTPGYRRVDVKFAPALEAAASALARTDPRHLGGAGNDGVQIVEGPRGLRPDGNGVDRDQELLVLTRNAGEFQNQADVLGRILTLRRIAATGEPR
jgi:flagellar basal-body rod protein FlgB